MHHGVDLAACSGTPVKSALSGTVIYAENRAGYGKCVDIKHKDLIETRYAHLSKIFVKSGDLVLTGQKIGLVGATGNVRGKNDPSHLHFELIVNGIRYNPLLHII